MKKWLPVAQPSVLTVKIIKNLHVLLSEIHPADLFSAPPANTTSGFIPNPQILDITRNTLRQTEI